MAESKAKAAASKASVPSIFERLNEINVKKLAERRGTRNNDPKYISWAVAWQTVKKMFPLSTYEVIKGRVFNVNEVSGPELSNVPSLFHTDGNFGWVEVVVNIVDSENNMEESATVDLPIMDNRMNSIPLDKITSRDANDTAMRAIVKALALCGFGLEMWIKDDTLNRLETGEHTDAASAENRPAPKKRTVKELVVLTEDHEKWNDVLKYVSTNKTMGLEKILTNLGKRYKFDDAVKLLLTEKFSEDGGED